MQWMSLTLWLLCWKFFFTVGLTDPYRFCIKDFVRMKIPKVWNYSEKKVLNLHFVFIPSCYCSVYKLFYLFTYQRIYVCFTFYRVMVKVKNLMNGNVWMWERGKFMNRRYMIQARDFHDIMLHVICTILNLKLKSKSCFAWLFVFGRHTYILNVIF